MQGYLFLHGAELSLGGIVKVGTAIGNSDGTDTVYIEYDPEYAFLIDVNKCLFQGNDNFSEEEQSSSRLVALGPSYKEYSRCDKMLVVERPFFEDLCKVLIDYYVECGKCKVGNVVNKKRTVDEDGGVVAITPSPAKRSKINDRFEEAFSNIKPEDIIELEDKVTAEKEETLILERSAGVEIDLERKIEALSEPSLKERVIAQVLFD